MAKQKTAPKENTSAVEIPAEIEKAHLESIKRQEERKQAQLEGKHLQRGFDVDVKASYLKSLPFAKTPEAKKHLIEVLTKEPKFDR